MLENEQAFMQLAERQLNECTLVFEHEPSCRCKVTAQNSVERLVNACTNIQIS